MRCERQSCRYRVHTMLRWGQGTHCCGRCKLGHKIHGFHCERVEFETAISAADDAAFGTDPDTTSAAAEHARAPSTDLRWDYADTDGDWSEPGPPDNINLLSAERQVIDEALEQLRDPDNTQGVVWIPDYQARFPGLGMTLRELLDSHEDKFTVDQDWWTMCRSYESAYVDHVSLVDRCI